MNKMEQVLAVKLPPNDAGASNVAHYLLFLAEGVYRWNEDFSGKRPFGNSSWWHEIETPVAEEFGLDEESDEARDLIFEALEYWIDIVSGVETK